jgi:hypothetical protein
MTEGLIVDSFIAFFAPGAPAQLYDFDTAAVGVHYLEVAAV